MGAVSKRRKNGIAFATSTDFPTTSAGPLRIGHRIVPRDLNYRMIFSSMNRTLRAFGVPPVRSRHPTPPSREIIERDGTRGWSED